MAITTYTELQTAVGNWLNRSDLTSRIPEFIVLAEEHFNNTLRVRQMEVTTTDTMSSSQITLPSGFQGFRSIYLKSGNEHYPLEYYSPEQQAEYVNTDTCRPFGYAIVGSVVQFFPDSDSDYTVKYTYYQTIPDIATNSTNWLLSAAPGAYLHGTLMQAYLYLKSADKVAESAQMMAASLDKLSARDQEDRWSGSTLRVRAV